MSSKWHSSLFSKADWPLVGTIVAIGITQGLSADVVLTWQDNSNDEHGFQIERAADGKNWEVIATVPPDTITHTVPGTDPAEVLTYRVRAFNASGPSLPSNATREPARITRHPQPASTLSGNPVEFSAEAVGTEPVGWTWFHNDEPLSDSERIRGSKSAELILLSSAPEDEGYYRVEASNSLGPARSESAFLEVDPPPQVTEQPKSKSARIGELNVALTVNATGQGPLRYQWFKDGEEIKGATMKFYIIDRVSIHHVGSYTVRISNSFGAVISEPAKLRTDIP